MRTQTNNMSETSPEILARLKLAEDELAMALAANDGTANLSSMFNWVNLVSVSDEQLADRPDSPLSPFFIGLANEIADAGYFNVDPERKCIVYPFVIWVNLDLPDPSPLKERDALYHRHWTPLLVHNLTFDGKGLKRTVKNSPHAVQSFGFQLIYNRPQLDVSLAGVSSASAWSNSNYNSQLQSQYWRILVPPRYQHYLPASVNKKGKAPAPCPRFITLYQFLSYLDPTFTKQNLAQHLKHPSIDGCVEQPAEPRLPARLELQSIPFKEKVPKFRRLPRANKKLKLEQATAVEANSLPGDCLSFMPATSSHGGESEVMMLPLPDELFFSPEEILLTL